nr:immunoglobulin light chain junction region [Macaca mulatta]
VYYCSSYAGTNAVLF